MSDIRFTSPDGIDTDTCAPGGHLPKSKAAPADSAARACRAYRVAAALEAKTGSGPDRPIYLMSLNLSLPRLRVSFALSRPEAPPQLLPPRASGRGSISDEGEAPLVPSGWWILPSAMVGAAIWVLLLVGLFS